MRRALSSLFLATAVVGCQTKSSDAAKTPLGQASAAPAAAAAATGTPLTGSVLEHMDAAGYTYMRIKTSAGEVWAAVSAAKVENGTTVTVHDPLMMANFESKSLKRTFPEIYFGTLTPVDTAATGAAGAHAAAGGSSAPVVVGKVEKATGADARTVGEVWAQKASLAGKSVTIRGTVVKFNEAVMGKNWIHLQDGSGDAKDGTNDILVTSMDGATKGDIITAKGIVRTNKDFGSGYAYAVLVEDGKVLKK